MYSYYKAGVKVLMIKFRDKQKCFKATESLIEFMYNVHVYIYLRKLYYNINTLFVLQYI